MGTGKHGAADGKAIGVVLCHVSVDQEFADELVKHLTPLLSENVISAWYPALIQPGEDWSNATRIQLNHADLIILLVSVDLLASGEQYTQICHIIDTSTTVRVVPIILRACDWRNTPVGRLQAIPRNGAPVASFNNADDAFAEIIRELRGVIHSSRHGHGRVASRNRGVIPDYPDDETRQLSTQLDLARTRKQRLQSLGKDTSEISKEILDLRRRIREGGQLRAGDSLSDDRYILLNKIGRGGFATVWRAMDTHDNHEVAIKVLHVYYGTDKMRLERLFRGARIMSQLSHPSIVRIIDSCSEDGGYHYYVMEFLSEGDLRRAVLAGTVNTDEIEDIVLQVGDALAHAHAKGYVHRDVKPANILLDVSGVAKLTDFDLVAHEDTTGGTRTGALGSLLYAAPELMLNAQDATARADVYGLGMTLIFGIRRAELDMGVIRNSDTLISGLECHDALKAILRRSVDWNPDARFETAKEFCDALRAAPTRVRATRFSVNEWIKRGDDRSVNGNPEEALQCYEIALAEANSALAVDIRTRMGATMARLGKWREAIICYEDVLVVLPSHREAAEATVALAAETRDWPALEAAEDRLLSIVKDEAERAGLLVSFAERWSGIDFNPHRVRGLLEQARYVRSTDANVLTRLREFYETMELYEDAITVGRRLADLTVDPHQRAKEYMALASHCLGKLKRFRFALELFDAALRIDPTFLEPLTFMEQAFIEQEDWSELEQVYKQMLSRLEVAPQGPARVGATWDIRRRLAALYRDHLTDYGRAVDVIEDALAEQPNNLENSFGTVARTSKEVALERTAVHLQALAALDSTNTSTFHALFEVQEKLRRPEQAYSVACVTMYLKCAQDRERDLYNEHRPKGLPRVKRSLSGEAWRHLRVGDTDVHIEAIFAAVAHSAVRAKIATLEKENRLPVLDPAAKQDPLTSKALIVRTFMWGSHALGVPVPALYILEDADVGLGAVLASEPNVIIGKLAMRRWLIPELAFLVGRHLVYHVGTHQLLLCYPSLEDLTTCLFAALRIVLKNLTIPPRMRDAVLALTQRINANMNDAARMALESAVAALDASGKPANIMKWVSGVEHCATRAGFLLSGDLDVAASLLRADPLGIVPTEEKISGLLGFAVSDAHHALRHELGVAIEPDAPS